MNIRLCATCGDPTYNRLVCDGCDEWCDIEADALADRREVEDAIGNGYPETWNR